MTLLAQDPDLRLSREAFFSRSGATQRGRILEAVTHVVAEKGYAGATVELIVRTAGVSRTTFYQLFAGKQECLLASYEVATKIVLDQIAEAATMALPDGWHAAFEAGLDAYLDTIRSQPEIARAQFVELGALGSDAISARSRAQSAHTDAIVALMDLAHTGDPTTPLLNRGTVRLIVAAIEERVTQVSAHGTRSDLDELRADVLRMIDHLAD